MLQLDSIVTDLMFQASAAIDQKTLIEGLGGEAALETKQLLDVDRLDPRAEMELSPSMPFRRRGERRLMIIDDKATTPREDPGADPRQSKRNFWGGYAQASVFVLPRSWISVNSAPTIASGNAVRMVIG